MKFDIVGDIEQIEAIASGRGVRIRSYLGKLYGKGRWRKLKGEATVHGIGRRDFKIKKYVDQR